MADVVSSQRFLRDDFVALAEPGATDSAVSETEPSLGAKGPVLISVSVVVADPAPADDTLFVRDSEPPLAHEEVPTVDNVLLERE